MGEEEWQVINPDGQPANITSDNGEQKSASFGNEREAEEFAARLRNQLRAEVRRIK